MKTLFAYRTRATLLALLLPMLALPSMAHAFVIFDPNSDGTVDDGSVTVGGDDSSSGITIADSGITSDPTSNPPPDWSYSTPSDGTDGTTTSDGSIDGTTADPTDSTDPSTTTDPDSTDATISADGVSLTTSDDSTADPSTLVFHTYTLAFGATPTFESLTSIHPSSAPVPEPSQYASFVFLAVAGFLMVRRMRGQAV